MHESLRPEQNVTGHQCGAPLIHLLHQQGEHEGLKHFCNNDSPQNNGVGGEEWSKKKRGVGGYSGGMTAFDRKFKAKSRWRFWTIGQLPQSCEEGAKENGFSVFLKAWFPFSPGQSGQLFSVRKRDDGLVSAGGGRFNLFITRLNLCHSVGFTDTEISHQLLRCLRTQFTCL